MKKQTNATGYGFDIGKAALSAVFVVEIVIYICFLRIDIFSGGAYELSAKLKYAGILLCVLCAVTRACSLRSRTAYLVAAALFFTALSDYFLLFSDVYLPGVLSFCVTQTIYLVVIMGAIICADNKSESGAYGVNEQVGLTRNSCDCGRYRKNGWILFAVGFIVTAAVIAILVIGNSGMGSGSDLILIAAAAFYAYSFLRNIVLAVILCAKERKARLKRTGTNGTEELKQIINPENYELRIVLFTAGLIVFALCDINVLLYNLPDFIEIHSHFILSLLEFAGNAMWAFYLPSQVMIAVSPRRISK